MSSDSLIPDRPFFKSAEVCSIAGVKPYILRSWEAEFHTLGQNAKKDESRVYRREDIELVLRIKELVFDEGLTLGAARRKIESQADSNLSAPDNRLLSDLFDVDVKDRLEEVKKGLRSILELLSAGDQIAESKESMSSVSAPKPKIQKKKTLAKRKKTST